MGNQQRSLELRLAWFGGIIDGEGTITFASKYSKSARQKTYHFRPQLDVTNSSDVMIAEITNLMKDLECGYYVREVNNPSKIRPNLKVCTEVHIEGIKRLQKLLPIITPYLICKRPQAELLMKYIDSRLSGPHKGPLTDEQEAIVLKVRQLNHRGVLNRPETVRRTPITNQAMIQSDLARDRETQLEIR